MTRAIVTRRFSHEGQSLAAGDVLDLSEGQFADWAAAGLVAAAPEGELPEPEPETAAGEPSPAVEAPAPRTARKGK